MKTFEELCSIYDRCKEEAINKLPSVNDVPMCVYVVPVHIHFTDSIAEYSNKPYPDYEEVINFRFYKTIKDGIPVWKHI